MYHSQTSQRLLLRTLRLCAGRVAGAAALGMGSVALPERGLTMPTILTREPAYAAWNPAELAGPYEPLTLREWEVAVATSALPEPAQKLLREELLEEATPACEQRQRWPLARRVLPCDEAFLRSATTATLRQQVIETLAALWQVLDLAPGVIPGMLRGLLLVGLSARLRQTLAAFQCQADALAAQRELEQALTTLGAQIEPTQEQPASLPPQRRKRWWWRKAA